MNQLKGLLPAILVRMAIDWSEISLGLVVGMESGVDRNHCADVCLDLVCALAHKHDLRHII